MSPTKRDFFKASQGAPDDACPNCGIHRRHAGNPEACGPGWRKPGCFDTSGVGDPRRSRPNISDRPGGKADG